MLCDTCKSLDIGVLCCRSSQVDQRWSDDPDYAPVEVPHHSSYKELRFAAEGGCELCLEILRGSERFGDHSRFEAQNTPIYCSAIGISYHTRVHSTFCEEEFKGVAIIHFEGWPKSSQGDPYLNFSSYLRVFCEHDSPLAVANIVGGRPVPPNPDSPLSLAVARMWLQKCLQEHRESCPQNPAKAFLPSRVIDVGPAEGFQAPYIHVSKANETGEWAILSHCWGQKIGYVTTSANLHSGISSLQHDALPATIKDAIKITRDIGLRYLWVDSICIVQGSNIEAHADWMVESSRMRDYYKNSVVCIAIDDAASDEEGFLGHTRPAEVRIPISTQYYPQDTDAPSTFYIGTDISHWTSMIDYRPILSSRGWTLQEEVLTPRTLHFTAKQLVWECQRHQSYESNMTAQSWPMNDSFHEMPKRYFLVPDFGRNYILSSDYPFIAKVLDPGDRWISMVNNYTKRSLTVQSDRLVAIGGLAQELQVQSGYNYCAGIWAEDIHRGLLWRLYGLGQNPESYIAPSWSWAALDFCAHDELWNSEFQEIESTKRAEILSCDVVTVDGNPYGLVISGCLRLRSLWLDFEQWRGSKYARIQTQEEESSLLNRHSDLFENFGLFDEHTEEIALQKNELKSPQSHQDSPRELEIQQFQVYLESLGKDGSNLRYAESQASSIGSDDSEDSSKMSWLKEISLRRGQLLINLDQRCDILQKSKRVRLGMVQICTVSIPWSPKNSLAYCLLLEPGKRAGTYRRIGLVEVPDLPEFSLKAWEMREVMIV